VGKSLKDLHSDRGAETYDYTQIIKEREREEKRKKKDGTEKEKSGLKDKQIQLDSLPLKEKIIKNCDGCG